MLRSDVDADIGKQCGELVQFSGITAGDNDGVSVHDVGMLAMPGGARATFVRALSEQLAVVPTLRAVGAGVFGLALLIALVVGVWFATRLVRVTYLDTDRTSKAASRVRYAFLIESRQEFAGRVDGSDAELTLVSRGALNKQQEAIVYVFQYLIGQHIDLVGSFKPDMREADDECIRKCQVYIDTEHGIKETGDLSEPIRKGILRRSMIRGDLFQLCRGERPGRTSDDQITLFKSVGHALEDLSTAMLAYSRLTKN